MKNTIFRFTKMACALAIGLMISEGQLARAGWTGAMNSTGYGKGSVNVTSPEKSKTYGTPNTNGPSVTMSYDANFFFGSSLPSGSSLGTVAQVKGFAGYVWQANTVGSNGDSTDNAELEARVHIIPADCASLQMESSAVVDLQHKSGTITVNTKGTAGTAIWLRGFELLGGQALPEDNPDTEGIDETLEFLKTHGAVKWDVLYVGPFDLNTLNCNAVKIPFTFETNPENLYFVSDGVAKSLPLVIQCPPSKEVNCDQQPVVYDPVQFAGCGGITTEYNPPAGTVFPVGINAVTATVTDKDGNKKSCTFNVIVKDTVAPVVPTLPPLTGEASVTVPQPPDVTDNCGGIIKATTDDPLSYKTQGTFTVHWKYDDNHGNVTIAEQKVIVDDVTPPATPTIATATGQCSVTVTPPTTTDIVAGTVTGTTSDPLTYSAQGTYTITWKFNDGNGNESTATQTVIVDDTIAPVAPTSLPIVTGNCSTPVTLTAPTATDNCKGTVTGTTTTTFPITTLGTTIVTWTFNDGNGNSSTASQTVTLAGLTFTGFYSPINGTGGSWDSPLRNINKGSNIPIKFDQFCGSTPITGGTPPVVRIQYWATSTSSSTLDTLNAVYQNDWHVNWDTTLAKYGKGKYKIVVTLSDGVTQQYAWVNLR